MSDFKEQIVKQMEAYFGQDRRRIRHALTVTDFAEEILKEEPGGDREVVVAAAILHDIGIHAAEKKHRSTAGRYQELEGPPIARRMLTALGMQEEKIEEACEIIANHHSPGKVQTINFKVVCDSDWLVNLPDEYKGNNVAYFIERVFLTETGKKLARKAYLQNTETEKKGGIP